MPPPSVRRNHTCSNGLVAPSRKNGSPIVSESARKIAATGWSACLAQARRDKSSRGQTSSGENDRSDIYSSPPPGMGAARQPMGIEIPKQQRPLKEHQARKPHRRRTAQRGKKLFGGHRLNQKQQKCAEEDGGAIEQAGSGHVRLRRSILSCEVHQENSGRSVAYATKMGMSTSNPAKELQTNSLRRRKSLQATGRDMMDTGACCAGAMRAFRPTQIPWRTHSS